MSNTPGQLPEADSERERFRLDVLQGLRAVPKELPCKYFYDAAGSRLFEQITRLEEYYLTRTELAIMEQHAAEMAAGLGTCFLIEYGSGSGRKTRLLLDQLPEPAGYVAIDLSNELLEQTVRELTQAYPTLSASAIRADFSKLGTVPNWPRAARRAVYFPGSTIGNFTPGEAVALLRQTAALCGPGGGLLLGADLKKDPTVLHAAYNDSQGITAAFNLNLLARINWELDADFAIPQFWHYAFYNPRDGRIEMHLISRSAQRVQVAGEAFSFAEGESIRTEYSYKYTIEALQRLAAEAGLVLQQAWTDQQRSFAVLCFAVASVE